MEDVDNFDRETDVCGKYQKDRCVKINKKPFRFLKMGSRRLFSYIYQCFSDKNRPAHKPEQQNAVNGAEYLFTADSIPVAEGEASDRCQKT